MNLVTLACLTIAFFAGLALGLWISGSRRISVQTSGEATLADVLSRSFPAPDYHLMNHITLRLEGRTTQIDHILVSRFGVFVIESKHYKGWIFAHEKQPQWTQVLFNGKFKFQNPLHQNFLHLIAVRHLLEFLPSSDIQSAVVFTGSAAFKTKPPPGVFSISEFVAHLHEQKTAVMSHNRLQFCVGRIETARMAISGETDVEHAQNLKQRYDN